MAFESGDYKPRRIPPPVGPRKIPLLRFLLVLGIVAFVYQHHQSLRTNFPQQLAQLKSLWQSVTSSDSSAVPVSASRKERMALAGGKLFVLQNGSVQESWRVQNAVRFNTVLGEYPEGALSSLIRTLVLDAFPSVSNGVLDLVFRDTIAGRLPLLARWRDSSGVRTVLRLPTDSLWSRWRYFDAQTRCVWQGPCPIDPLAGGAVSIDADFDFAGKEQLMTHDMFRGIGEAPVVAVLPGRVQFIHADSVHGVSVSVVHSGNEESVVTGMATLAEGLKIGSLVQQGAPLGKLSARDTAEVLFQFRRNGRFVRWDEYCREARPLSDSLFATFAKGLFL